MTQPPSLNPKLLLSTASIKRGIERLEKCISDLIVFDVRTMVDGESPPLDALTLAIKDILERSFGENTSAYKRFIGAANLRHGGALELLSGQAPDYNSNTRRNIGRSVGLLKAAQEALKEDLAEHDPSIEVGSSAEKPAVVPSNRVFVVHGHDEGARELVARFLMQLGFVPIILHEQANRGGTVIEKIEAYGDVGFAVVLLTPDDEGSVKGDAD